MKPDDSRKTDRRRRLLPFTIHDRILRVLIVLAALTAGTGLIRRLIDRHIKPRPGTVIDDRTLDSVRGTFGIDPCKWQKCDCVVYKLVAERTGPYRCYSCGDSVRVVLK